MSNQTTYEPRSMTAMLVFDSSNGQRSACAFDTGGEVLETVNFDDNGQPEWHSATICDDRGEGGERGYLLLCEALEAAEANINAMGYRVARVS